MLTYACKVTFCGWIWDIFLHSIWIILNSNFLKFSICNWFRIYSLNLFLVIYSKKVLNCFSINYIIFLNLGINLAGVKWVIRLQFGLLIVLLLAALDLAVGTFIQVDLGIDLVLFIWIFLFREIVFKLKKNNNLILKSWHLITL